MLPSPSKIRQVENCNAKQDPNSYLLHEKNMLLLLDILYTVESFKQLLRCIWLWVNNQILIFIPASPFNHQLTQVPVVVKLKDWNIHFIVGHITNPHLASDKTSTVGVWEDSSSAPKLRFSNLNLCKLFIYLNKVLSHTQEDFIHTRVTSIMVSGNREVLAGSQWPSAGFWHTFSSSFSYVTHRSCGHSDKTDWDIQHWTFLISF